MEEQEGFAEDKASEIVEYHCQVPFPAARPQHRPYVNRLKLLNHFVQLQDSLFLNNSLKLDQLAQMVQKKLPDVVYNSFNKVLGENECEEIFLFDGSFESGNLQLAIRRDNKSQAPPRPKNGTKAPPKSETFEYDLYMRADSNTKSHFQWFYFKVRNKKKRKISLSIKNFIKPNMLYAKGLRPFYRSKKERRSSYQQVQAESRYWFDQNEQKYTLSFEFAFKHEQDEVQFCSQPPYTYEHLQRRLQQKFSSLHPLSSRILGRTVMGKPLPYFIVNESPGGNRITKAVSVVMARQHPGESVGSWMMEGFIQKVLEKASQHQELMWVIIPMHNVDGVLLGNNRTGLLGHDFNRNWSMSSTQPSLELKQPETTIHSAHLKYMLEAPLKEIKQLKQNNHERKRAFFPENDCVINLLKSLKKKYNKKLRLFIDFHGHSSQPNAFSYGPPHSPQSQYFLKAQVLPLLISQKNPNFKLDQCSFSISQGKSQCSRSVLFGRLGIPYAYTVESSFGIYQGARVGEKEFLKMGEDVAQSAIDFLSELYVKEEGSAEMKKRLQDLKKRHLASQNSLGEEDESEGDASLDGSCVEEFESKINSLLRDKSSYESELKKIRIGVVSENKLKAISADKSDNFRKLNVSAVYASNQHSKRKRRGTEEEDLILKDTRRLHTEALISDQPEKEREESQNNSFRLPRLSQGVSNNRNSAFIKEGRKHVRTEAEGEGEECDLQSLSFMELKKRLLRMRNSKMGKKILVLNAYGQ